MTFHLSIVGRDANSERLWAEKLAQAAADVIDASVTCSTAGGELGPLVFVDSSIGDLESRLEQIDRKGRAVFLMLDEAAAAPSVFAAGKVDDVLIYPFRSLEVLGKIQRYQQLLMWEEVGKLNASFSELLSRLGDDLKLAERLQKSKLPVRFPDIKGLKISHRYLAGMRSGGDHFDIAESPDRGLISMVLSDSSSYGLSSAVLSVLMRVAVKLSTDETRSAAETVQRIQEELLSTLGDKDKLSLFYGVISRKDYKLRYINLGNSCAFYAPPGAAFQRLDVCGSVLARASGPISSDQAQRELVLEPEGRLVLLSDGFVEATGGLEATDELLTRFRAQESVESLNELVFQVKSKFEEEDDMPAQDCTAAIFDLDARLIRLASK